MGACCSQTLLKQAGEGPGWDLMAVLWETNPNAAAAQTQNNTGLSLQERHFSSALKSGDETTPDGNENTPVGVEPPQDAGGWTGHPCSASPTAWGWLALMVCVRDGYGTTHSLPQILLFFWPRVWDKTWVEQGTA